MTTPRPTKVTPWTWIDHQDNEQRKQRAADRRLWERLGRLIGLRGRDLTALLSRFMDDRITAVLRAHNPPLLDQLKVPAEADALRGALMDVLADDIAEVFLILTNQEGEHEPRDKEETPGGGGENATYEQREIYPPDEEEA